MKKIITILLVAVMSISIIACGNDATEKIESDSNKETTQAATSVKDGKSIVIYFSYADNTDIKDVHSEDYDDLSSASITMVGGERQGNNKVIADMVAEETKADIFSIVMEDKYTSDYDKVADIGKKENDDNIRPKLSSKLDNLNEYQNVYFVYPIWWYDFPMAVKSFFEEYDFAGKNIYPIFTSGGSGESGTVDQIKEYEPKATVYETPLEVYQRDVANAHDDVKKWLGDIK